MYDYDLIDGWRHDLRVEQIVALDPGRAYPACIGGRRAAPPEGRGGPRAFLEWRQQRCLLAAAARRAELLDGEDTLDEHREEVLELCPWLALDRFDRRAVNRRLAVQAAAAWSVA